MAPIKAGTRTSLKTNKGSMIFYERSGVGCISVRVRSSHRQAFLPVRLLCLQLPGYALRRIIEECLLRNAFPFPALVSEFLHAGRRAVQPFEVEYPADDHHVAVDENRPDALRHERLRSRQYLAIVCRVGIAPDARHCLILLH